MITHNDMVEHSYRRGGCRVWGPACMREKILENAAI